MKSTSLYVFLALGALFISHTSAAPISELASLGKEFIKFLVSSNEQAEVEAETSDSVENQVDALIQVAFDGMNDALEVAQQYIGGRYRGGRYPSQGRYDTFEDSFRK